MEKKPVTRSNCMQKVFCSIIVILTLILIGIAFLIYNDIQKAAKKSIMQCQVNYLNSNGFYDESFDSVGDFFGNKRQCVEEMKKKIEIDTQKRLNAKAGHRSYTICMINFLKNDSNYNNGILLLEVIDYSKLSWKFWKYFERNSRYEILQNQMGFHETYALGYCKRDDDNIDGSGHSDGLIDLDDEGGDDSSSEQQKVHEGNKLSNSEFYFDES